ncbi:MAG: hypothetical protein BWK79_03695 [Beggiatoa sp. IS2]|nr:MAG: hypothetical protein BWK79_03695 [Beggiatoa sp. IS2]
MPQNNVKTVVDKVKIDWSVFKWAFVALLFSILAGGVFVVGGQKYEQYWIERQPKENARLKEVSKRYQKASDASDIVSSGDLDMYYKLVQEDFFYEDEKISTKEQFVALIQQVKIFLATLLAEKPFSGIKPKLEFTATDQIPYPVEQFGMAKELKVYGTPLQFEIELLHDGDMLKLLQEFQVKQSVGFVKLHRCEVERLRKTNLENASQPHLKLKCTLMWYTAHLEKTTEKSEEKLEVKKK